MVEQLSTRTLSNIVVVNNSSSSSNNNNNKSHNNKNNSKPSKANSRRTSSNIVGSATTTTRKSMKIGSNHRDDPLVMAPTASESSDDSPTPVAPVKSNDFMKGISIPFLGGNKNNSHHDSTLALASFSNHSNPQPSSSNKVGISIIAHGNTQNPEKLLAELLQTQQWENAVMFATQRPKSVKKPIIIEKFYEDQFSSKVFAIHIACANQAPPNVIESLHNIYPNGLVCTDSRYQRVPLHIAVLNGAPPKSVSKLTAMNKQAALVQDILGRIPLHYACEEPTFGESYVRCLLSAYPESIRIADKEGSLPLHTACRTTQSNMSIIRMLIRNFPEAILRETDNGQTPVMCAEMMQPGTMSLEMLRNCEKETETMLHGQAVRRRSNRDALTDMARQQRLARHLRPTKRKPSMEVTQEYQDVKSCAL